MRSQNDEIDDSFWIHKAQVGDIEAFGKLVEIYHVKILAYLAVRVNTAHDAEDLAQDTFLHAHRRLVDFDPERPLGPWLYGIAYRLLINSRRKHRPAPIGGSPELDALLTEHIEKRNNSSSEDKVYEALEQCRQRLSESDCILLRDRYALGKSIDEIGSQADRKPGAIAMKLHRLRVALKSCIEGKLAKP